MAHALPLRPLLFGLVVVAALHRPVPESWAGEPVVGGAAALPYPEAVTRSRTAAAAVLKRAGVESCLRGKLTNALLGLSASCDAQGVRTPLCGLANQAVVSGDWSLPFMDATARAVLNQP